MKECKKCDTGLDALQMDETPKLIVKGREVGINDLDGIMEEVCAKNLPEGETGSALLDLVKKKDYVPPSMEKEYREALVNEYRRRYG